MDTKSNIYLTVKDYSVSGEEFQLIKNSKYGFLQTSPQPSKEDLPEYYKTEDYISHTNSKRNLFEKVYHQVRNISLKQKLKLINSFDSKTNTEDKSLLDIGCGTGAFLKTAQDNGWNISGVEPNEEARQIANQTTNNSVLNIEALLDFENNSFDVITLWHVLEHLPNLEEHVVIFKRLLKDKGRLVIAVPNYNSFDAKHYKMFWAAFDVPRHLWHFSRESIKNLFATQNMKVVKTKPMRFDAYYVSLLSEKYKSKSMNPVRAFFVGWRSNFKAKRSGEYSSLIYVIKNEKINL